MKTISFTKAFTKNFKTLSKQGKINEKYFEQILTSLANGESLSSAPPLKDHKCKSSSPKDLQGLRIFHLSNDICVIYERGDNEITMYEIGSHSTLRLDGHR